jgi:hypothetical protein
VTATLTPNLAVLVPLSKLRVHPSNPRTITASAFERLKHALEADPNHLWQRPLAARTDGTVYCGNMRLLAVQKLGWSEAPVVYEDLPAKEEDLRRLRDNASYGEDDDQALAELLYHLKEQDADLSLTGFDDAAVSELLDSVSGLELATDDADLTPPTDPVTKPGDLWLLGEHRLLCGDSTNPDDVARLMAGRKAAAVITDPPFSVRDDRWDTFEGDVAFAAFTGAWLVNAYGSADVVATFFADKYVPLLLAAAVSRSVPYRRALIWRKPPGSQFAGASLDGFWFDFEIIQVFGKPTFSPDKETRMAVLEHRTVTGQEHGCEKPVELLCDIVRGYSRRGDTVVDLFGGVGTTLLAADSLGRSCFSLEQEPAWCDVIINRWQTATGKTATLAPRKEG